MRYSLPYGRAEQSLELPEDAPVTWIDPADAPSGGDPLEIVATAIDHPLGPSLADRLAGTRTVAVAVNDKTRPVPNHWLLPPLLKRIEAAGIPPDNIRLLIATGTHTPMPAAEFGRILPDEMIARYPVISHDCEDLENLYYLGNTSYQTPVLANRVFQDADVRIVVGDIEPHHFAGFSGGAKTAAIGLTGRETITHNHAMLLEPGARMGEFDHNPIRQDIEEIGGLMGIHFALNAVLNARKQIVAALFGDPAQVIRAGMPVSRKITQTLVPGYFDLVIASAGGYPKDINFYQAQKAMTYAAELTREGGTIILVAACPEGSGSQGYERFMDGVDSYPAAFEKFQRQGFQVGPHKAIQVGLIGTKKRLIMVSDMSAEMVYHFLITPAPDLQSAYELAKRYLPAGGRIAILPHATNTIPVVGAQA